MSIQAIEWAIAFDAENATEKAVLFMLANYSDGDGKCFPGQQNIARQAACSERSVRRVLDSLEERGVIKRIERRRGDGSRTSDAIVLVAFIQAANLSGSDEPTGQSVQTNRPSCQSQPDTVSGLTTFEPSDRTISLSETSSDATKKAKSKKRAAYPELFESTWQAYPTDKLMSKKEAFDAWHKLDDEDRQRMAAAAPAFRAYCREHPDYRPIHFCRFVTKRRFDNFAQSVPEPGTITDDDWRKRLRYGRHEEAWFSKPWGPPPGRAGCIVPEHLIEQGDGQGWREIEERQHAA